MNNVLRVFRICIGMFFVACTALTQPVAKPADWSSFHFLVGEWVGDGSGQPGQGAGRFTFFYDVQNRLLIRKSFADYPAGENTPAFSHDDLMILYQEDTAMKAMYFDNEGHVIHYNVAVEKADSSWIFLSEPSSSSPGFRLTYKQTGSASVKLTFEIAMPGKPFSPYLTASAHRISSGAQ